MLAASTDKTSLMCQAKDSYVCCALSLVYLLQMFQEGGKLDQHATAMLRDFLPLCGLFETADKVLHERSFR